MARLKLSGRFNYQFASAVMKPVYFYVPAVVCGAISLLALLGSVRNFKLWQPIFYAFLPACFLYVSTVMVRMNHEIMRLRRRISRLEQKGQTEMVTPPRSTLQPSDNGSED